MINKNIFISFFLLGLCLIGFSCKKFFTEKGKELTEQPLARVNEIFLYPSDIAGMGSGNTRQDSIKIVNGYILDWVQRNLIIDKAEKNLPKELLDIDKKVDNYRQSLIIYNYESELIAQKLNTSIAKEEKQKYHQRGKEKYIIDEDFLIRNHGEIWSKKIGYDESNNVIRNIGVGILVTYEELFLYGTGQDKIEKYMSFKSTTKLDTDLKKSRFHIIDRTLHTTYDLAYNKIINLELEFENMLKERELIINNLTKLLNNSEEKINNLNITINNLNITINNLNQTIVDLVSSKNR